MSFLKILLIVLGGFVTLGSLAVWHVSDRIMSIDPSNPPNMAPQVVYYLVPFLVVKSSVVYGVIELLVSKIYAPLNIGWWYWMLIGATASCYFAYGLISRFLPVSIDNLMVQISTLVIVVMLMTLTWSRRRV